MLGDFMVKKPFSINWGVILTQLSKKLAEPYPVVLVAHGLSLIPEALFTHHLAFYTTGGRALQNAQKWPQVQHDFARQAGYIVVKVPTFIFEPVQNCQYLSFCLSVIDQLISLLNKFAYMLDEHLQNRYFEGGRLNAHPVVQQNLAQVVMDIELAQALRHDQPDISACSESSVFLLQALDRLIKLGGARSILRDQLVELYSHVIGFCELYLRTEKEVHDAQSSLLIP